MSHIIIAIALVLISSLSCSAQGEIKEVVMAALGDSITTAADAIKIGDHPECSWATGDPSRCKVSSHLDRLQQTFKRFGISFSGVNAAQNGAKSADLEQQAKALFNLHPFYVTIEIGANDICSWPEDYRAQLADFKIKIANIIGLLIESNHDIRVALAPIPNLNQLYLVGSQKGCQAMWGKFRFCSPLLDRRRSASEREAFATRWKATNEVLSQVALEFPDNVRFMDQLVSLRIKSEHISEVDCYHPSIEGQNAIAEITWQSGWFGSHQAQAH